MRFYDGTRASNNRSKAADRLVRSYMSNINRARRASENYGGSTGGLKIIDGGSGLKQIQTRQARQADLRQIFQRDGTGRYGARKESFIGRMTDPDSDERKALIAEQKEKKLRDPSAPSWLEGDVPIRKQKGMTDDDEVTTT